MKDAEGVREQVRLGGKGDPLRTVQMVEIWLYNVKCTDKNL